jgi:hypothetical protein
MKVADRDGLLVTMKVMRIKTLLQRSSLESMVITRLSLAPAKAKTELFQSWIEVEKIEAQNGRA